MRQILCASLIVLSAAVATSADADLLTAITAIDQILLSTPGTQPRVRRRRTSTVNGRSVQQFKRRYLQNDGTSMSWVGKSCYGWFDFVGFESRHFLTHPFVALYRGKE
jgi:hypothetical protein